jgi:hypothetical protein
MPLEVVARRMPQLSSRLRFLGMALFVLLGLASLDPCPSFAQGDMLCPKLKMSLVFAPRAYLLNEPVAGKVVVTNVSRETVETEVLHHLNHNGLREGNLAIEVVDRMELSRVPIKPLRGPVSLVVPLVRYRLAPGQSFLSYFILDEWLAKRGVGSFEVRGELMVGYNREWMIVPGYGSFSSRKGTAHELEQVVDRLSADFIDRGVGPTDGLLREHLIERIALVDSPRATEFLARVARNRRDPHFRGLAIRQLGAQPSAQRLAVLESILGDSQDEEGVRQAAASALRVFPAGEGARLLAGYWRDRHETVRTTVALAMAAIRSPWATEVLRRMTDDPSDDICVFARLEVARRARKAIAKRDRQDE